MKTKILFERTLYHGGKERVIFDNGKIHLQWEKQDSKPGHWLEIRSNWQRAGLAQAALLDLTLKTEESPKP
jgi:hypothetical protein